MYESSGSITDKLIETNSGNVYHDMGLFLECLNSIEGGKSDQFKAKYCTVFFDSYYGMLTNESHTDCEGEPVKTMSNFNKASVSFCIPSTCSASDLRTAVAHSVRHLSLISITSEDYCYTQDKIRADKQFDIGAIITW